MDAIRRIVGTLLLLTAVIIGFYFVIDQLEILPFLWPQLDMLMGVSIVLGLIFAYLRKRSLEAAGLDRIITRRYLETNIMFYGFLMICLLFFWNWFDFLLEGYPEGAHRRLVWVIINVVGTPLWGAMGIFLLRGGKDD